MTLASDVANMLLKKGYNGLYPWTSNNTFGFERIYYKDGYVELSGKYGFRAENLELFKDFIKDCEKCLNEWKEKRKQELEKEDCEYKELPF